MIDYLHEVEQKLPALLYSLDDWQTRFVTYEKPHVERLVRQDGLNRIYLHRILWCDREDAYFHTHPWPSAMRILEGSYEMQFGHREGEHPYDAASTQRLVSAGRVIMQAGNEYEMTHVDAAHSVQPLTPFTLSLMVTGPVWAGSRTAPVQNPDLSESAALALLAEFRRFYPLV